MSVASVWPFFVILYIFILYYFINLKFSGSWPKVRAPKSNQNLLLIFLVFFDTNWPYYDRPWPGMTWIICAGLRQIQVRVMSKNAVEMC